MSKVKEASPRYLPDNPSDELLNLLRERAVFGLLDVLSSAGWDARRAGEFKRQPFGHRRYQLIDSAVTFANLVHDELREYGHQLYGHSTLGEQLRYLADLFDYMDAPDRPDWDEPEPLPCVDEGRPVPMPAWPEPPMPKVRRTIRRRAATPSRAPRTA